MKPAFEQSVEAIKGFILTTTSIVVLSYFIPATAALILSVLVLGFITMGREVYFFNREPEKQFDSFFMILGGIVPLLLILVVQVLNATNH